jgi:hypothetical protein
MKLLGAPRIRKGPRKVKIIGGTDYWRDTALRHQESDRLPISDFVWGGFTRRRRKELNLPDERQSR